MRSSVFRMLLAVLFCMTFVSGHAGAAGNTEAMMQLPQADRPLEQRFQDPPAESRILPITHGWPDGVEAQDNLIRTLLVRGFGGVVTNISFTGYLENEEKWAEFVRIVKECRKAGMSMWLYDEHGYPSGVAFGITMREHPEWEARGLLIADAESSGGKVTLDLPPGKLVSAVACQVEHGTIDPGKALDLSTCVKDGKMSWDAPQGQWHVLAITEDRLYEGTHAAISLCDKLPYINLLMPEPTARFVEVTHDAYAKHLGDDLSRYFVAAFTDEPSLMSMFFNPMPYRVLPWSPNLPVEFKKRRGYELKPVLPGLIVDAGHAGARARYDFWQTVAELVSENFFGQLQNWCRRHKIDSGGHNLMEESMVAHVQLYGDFFQCIRRLDAPSIDCLTSIPAEVPWYIARLIGSAADLENRPVTMSETSDHVQRYRPAGDTRPPREVTEDEIRGTCNKLIVSGINTITSYYSFTGLSDEQLKRLNTWVGRCCTMLKGGHQVADIAVLYPIESMWPKFSPARHWAATSAEAKAVDDTFRRVSDAIFQSGRDFTYVDGRTLAEAKVEDGTLVCGSLRWRVVVLPDADTLSRRAWLNLVQFQRSGGVVIAAGALPANTEREFPSPKVQAWAKEIFDGSSTAHVSTNRKGGVGIFLPLGEEKQLPGMLDSVLRSDVDVFGEQSPVRATHRSIDGHEVYFLINDSGATWNGRVSLAVRGKGERWDPTTGEVTPLDSGDDINLSMGPYGAMFFRFTGSRAPERLTPR